MKQALLSILVSMLIILTATSANSQTLKVVHSFCSRPTCADGYAPVGGLIQATDGNLYGVATSAITARTSTLFEMNLNGAVTTLYTLPTGTTANAGLVQATNGGLYGTTVTGGAYGYGSVFELTPGGLLTFLYSFCSVQPCKDGKYPTSALTQLRMAP